MIANVGGFVGEPAQPVFPLLALPWLCCGLTFTHACCLSLPGQAATACLSNLAAAIGPCWQMNLASLYVVVLAPAGPYIIGALNTASGNYNASVSAGLALLVKAALATWARHWCLAAGYKHPGWMIY